MARTCTRRSMLSVDERNYPSFGFGIRCQISHATEILKHLFGIGFGLNCEAERCWVNEDKSIRPIAAHCSAKWCPSAFEILNDERCCINKCVLQTMNPFLESGCRDYGDIFEAQTQARCAESFPQHFWHGNEFWADGNWFTIESCKSARKHFGHEPRPSRHFHSIRNSDWDLASCFLEMFSMSAPLAVMRWTHCIQL